MQMDLFGGPEHREHPVPTTEKGHLQGVQFKGGWSGPVPGQSVMGPDMGESMLGDEGTSGHLSADEHGNIQETGAVASHDPLQSAIGAYQNKPLLDAISRSPVRMVRSDTPVHTLQEPTDTAGLYDLIHGPDRRRDLDASVAREGIREPVGLVKHQDRLLVADGHHRLLAARKAGHSHFPAQVFDHDAHVASGGHPLNGRYGNLHPEDHPLQGGFEDEYGNGSFRYSDGSYPPPPFI